tara:strand:- start:10619 stop:10933 length:315 start_codon:yes stop_codon:yes gene_type:complete
MGNFNSDLSEFLSVYIWLSSKRFEASPEVVIAKIRLSLNMKTRGESFPTAGCALKRERVKLTFNGLAKDLIKQGRVSGLGSSFMRSTVWFMVVGDLMLTDKCSY